MPEGHLTGKTVLHRFIEWLYVITGQRGGDFNTDAGDEWPGDPLWATFKQRFAAAGFTLQIEQIPLENSSVTVVIAQKQA